MKKANRLLPLLAIALAITSAFAFQNVKKMKANPLNTYYYVYSGTTTDLADYKETSNWSTAYMSDPGGCNGGASLPCVVTSSFSDRADFIDDITTNGAGVVDNHVADYKH